MGKEEKAKSTSEEDNPIVKEIKSADEFLQKKAETEKERRGYIEKAIRGYKSVAEGLQKSGRRKEAVEVYLRAGVILRQMKQWDYAAQMYEKAGDFNEIGRLYDEAALTAENDRDRQAYAGRAENVYEQLRERSKLIKDGKIRKVEPSDLEEAASSGIRVAAAILGIAGFLVLLLFLSGSFTGYAVASNSSRVASSVGAIIFVLAIAFCFLLYVEKHLKKFR